MKKIDARFLDVGTSPNQIPQNKDLGSSAYQDIGINPDQIPQNKDLGTGAYQDIGINPDQIPQNKDLGTGAYQDISTFTGATSASEGNVGLVPKPTNKNSYLSSDGTWKSIGVSDPIPNPIFNWNCADSLMLHPKATFSRGSSGSYFDSNGILRYNDNNIPRFDHDPLTGICKGLLVEPAVTFLDTYSEQFDNVAWTKTRASITANAAVAPDGTMTADKLFESDTYGSHIICKTVGLTAGWVTTSVFVKASERDKFIIKMSDYVSAVISARFDISAGEASIVSAPAPWSAVSCSITYVGGGYYRCSVTGMKGQGTIVSSELYLEKDGLIDYTGDGTSGLYIWGAKIYIGSGPTSYLPTTTTGVTRAADVCNVDLTQLNDVAGNSLWTGAEGTIVVDFIGDFANSDSRYIFTNDNGSWTNRIDIYGNRNGLQVTVVKDGGAYNVIQNVQTSGTAKKNFIFL